MKQVTLFFVVLLTTFGCFSAEVLIIESYNKDYKWDSGYLRALNDYFAANHNIKTFEMNTKQIPASEYQAQADEAFKYFSQVKPDLVILGDDNASKFLGKRIEQTGVGVVFLGVNSTPRDYFDFNKGNVAGLRESPAFLRSIGVIGYIFNKQPERILILLDSGTTSKLISNELQEQTSNTQVQIDILNIGDFISWKQVVLSSKDNHYDAIIVGLYHTLRENNQHISDEEVITWTSKNSPLPLFGFWDFSVGKGKAIGGYVLDGYSHGLEAAMIAEEYLKYKKFKTVGSRTGTKGSYYFSKFELERWNLTLPYKISKSTIYTE